VTEVKSMWGDGIRAGLAVTVDVDADTFWFGRFERNAVPPCAQSEALYGIQAGLPRLLRMFDRLACRGTFFVPGWIAERYPQEIGAIVAEKHEIAYHGYLHEKTAGAQDEQSLIVRCKEIFLDQWGIRPVGYRYPEFGLRPDLIDILIDEGFLYSSNLMDRDQPYLLQGSGDRHLVELPTSWLFDDSSHFFFTIYPPPRRPIAPPSHVREIWETEFEGISREGGSMVLVLHPSISGRTSRVRMLEELLLSIKDHPGNLIAPASELAERARMALREMVDRDTGL
jgi:peptidoglycan/xylan/chitin deacetylase (PgdA/CDA1 family)